MLALVTGGSGFIGGHLVDELLAKGWQVISIDDHSATSTEKFYSNKNFVNYGIDIGNKEEMEEFSQNLLKQDKKIYYVFHLAARTKIQLAIKDFHGAFNTNVMGTINVLELCREHGVKRMVLSSTSSVYGNNPSPNVETQIPDCLNPYATSKLCCEKVCDLYTSLYDVETVKLRYFNVFGERMPNRGSYAPVVAIFTKQKKNNLPLTVVGDGTQKRDFVYVKDVARANIMVAEAQKEKVVGEVFNVGAGENFVVKDIANFISPNQVHIAERKGEADTTLANVQKIKQCVGWIPSINLNEWLELQEV